MKWLEINDSYGGFVKIYLPNVLFFQSSKINVIDKNNETKIVGTIRIVFKNNIDEKFIIEDKKNFEIINNKISKLGDINDRYRKNFKGS